SLARWASVSRPATERGWGNATGRAYQARGEKSEGRMYTPFDSRRARARRHRRIRKRVVGSPARPRLSVFRSLKHIYAQVIDDSRGMTLASASSNEPKLRGNEGAKTSRAQAVGALI